MLEISINHLLLGLVTNASSEEIDHAFRKRAHTTHPDVNKDDPHAKTRFVEIKKAYSALSKTQESKDESTLKTICEDNTNIAPPIIRMFAGRRIVATEVFGHNVKRQTA